MKRVIAGIKLVQYTDREESCGECVGFKNMKLCIKLRKDCLYKAWKVDADSFEIEFPYFYDETNKPRYDHFVD